MSTCPDEKLYCAFIDGEVPPLLKENLQIHLSKCERCKCILDRYKFIKFALVSNEAPDLDLSLSFEKLITRRNLSKRKRYLIFSANMRYKIIASAVASVFLFAFLFMLLRSNSRYDRTYTLHKGEVRFTPIVPMSYRQHNNVLTNIDFHDLTSVIKTNKKYNKKVYTNIINTFNNFSCLYTSLENNNNNNFAITMPNSNEEMHYNYGISISIYANLNKNVK